MFQATRSVYQRGTWYKKKEHRGKQNHLKPALQNIAPVREHDVNIPECFTNSEKHLNILNAWWFPLILYPLLSLWSFQVRSDWWLFSTVYIFCGNQLQLLLHLPWSPWRRPRLPPHQVAAWVQSCFIRAGGISKCRGTRAHFLETGAAPGPTDPKDQRSHSLGIPCLGSQGRQSSGDGRWEMGCLDMLGICLVIHD